MRRDRLQRWLPGLAVAGLPLAAAAAIVLAVALTAGSGRVKWPVALVPVHAHSVRQLAATFDRYQYAWPPATKVPPIAVRSLPDGLEALQPEQRKSLFLRTLLPLIMAANNRIRRERAYLMQVLKDAGPGAWPERVKTLAARYDVQDSLDKPRARADLVRRCNIVPPALVLAQAAKESGWGTSRFALEGNNLFGVHTWSQETALHAGASSNGAVRVRVYPDLRASVRDYIHNLNIGHAYVAFRNLRARQDRGGHLDAVALARTLGEYSTLGELYTRRLQALIRANGLEDLRALRLAPVSLRP